MSVSRSDQKLRLFLFQEQGAIRMAWFDFCIADQPIRNQDCVTGRGSLLLTPSLLSDSEPCVQTGSANNDKQ